MFVNTKSAYKFAEECAAKQKAAKAKCDNTISSGSSSSDLTKTTKSGENDIIGEQVTIRPESKWLLERNENIKADAVTMIQDAITTQEGRKVKISDMIEHNAQIGSARLEGCNQRGALLSMNKIKSLQAQAKQIAEILVALEKLCLDISSGNVKPGNHAILVKEILALPTSPSEKICDEEMLKELNRLCLGSGEAVQGEQ